MTQSHMEPWLSFLDRWAPGYRQTLQGERHFSTSLMAFHEDYDLPYFYHAMLDTMGASMGDHLFAGVSFHPRDIDTWYCCEKEDAWPIPDDVHVAAIPEEEDRFWFLDLTLINRHGDVPIFSVERDDDIARARRENFRFHSLRDMLYYEVFSELAMPRFGGESVLLRFIGSPDEAAFLHQKIAATLHLAGLQRQEGTSDDIGLFARDDVLVCTHRLAATPSCLEVEVVGKTDLGSRQFADLLNDRFPLVLTGFNDMEDDDEEDDDENDQDNHDPLNDDGDEHHHHNCQEHNHNHGHGLIMSDNAPVDDDDPGQDDDFDEDEDEDEDDEEDDHGIKKVEPLT